jgi:ATP:ADP antiporter, AAA family
MTANLHASPPSSHRTGPLDRVLRLFADVRDGEGTTATLLALNVFLLLATYYCIRPVREALILSATGGPELKSYLAAGQAVLLLGLVPAYGALADRLPRRRLLNTVTAFFVICLVAFYALMQAAVPIAAVFFLWVGIFNLMIVAQFWSFANDLYTKEQGERLFAIVAVGASLGAVLGARLAGSLIPLFGLPQLLLIAAGLLGIAVTISNLVDARERAEHEAHLPSQFTTAELPAATGEYQVQMVEDEKKLTVSLPGAPISRRGTFRLVFENRYLLLIALLIMFVNWVNTTGEYILSRTVVEAAKSAVASGSAAGLSESEYIGQFYSEFLFVVSLAALGLQLFVVSRLIKYVGVRVGVMVLPVLAFMGYTVLAFIPVLALVRLVKIAENATDYSIQNTVRNVLFLPTSRDEKYKAKQAIDSFFWRAGDVLSALLVFVGITMLGFGTSAFARANLVLTCVWLLLAFAVGREYTRKSRALERDTQFQ